MRPELVLEQDKLDVRNKTRSNIFNWRGQFTPQFVEYLLSEFTSGTDTVADPFCGSGTVLLECAAKGISAVGCEINPAAYAMSKFFTFCNASMSARRNLIDSLGEKIQKIVIRYDGLPSLIPSPDFRNRYRNLLELVKELLMGLDNKQERLLALLTLFHAESSPNGSLSSTVRRSFNAVKEQLISSPFSSGPIRVRLSDARQLHQWSQLRLNLIITSPPYINVFNYHQNYRAILEILGFDMLKVAQSEIGSNRKNRGNRYRTVIQYCLEIEQAVDSFARSLVPSGHLIMVVGRESRVRGIPFSNSSIVREVVDSIGCFKTSGFHQRSFTNRFGEKIVEDIIIAQRTPKEPHAGRGKEIGKAHLQKALVAASGSLRDEIRIALEQAEEIEASPLFNLKEVV